MFVISQTEDYARIRRKIATIKIYFDFSIAIK